MLLFTYRTYQLQLPEPKNAKLFTFLNKISFMPKTNRVNLFWITLDSFTKQRFDTGFLLDTFCYDAIKACDRK